MARRFSHARIKSHRSYEIEELAVCVGVTPQTVRTWIKEGLPAITDKRPFLIIGYLAARFCGNRMSACPECGATQQARPSCDDGWLVERQSRFNPFLGCVHFPDCIGKAKFRKRA